MKLKDSVVIAQDRDTVWRALNDPQVLRQSIPGCQELEQLDEENMKAAVVIKVGPVKARFKGGVSLSEINAPESYLLSGKGEGGVAGFAKGTARVVLEDQGPSETLLSYDVDAVVGGKLAQLGARLLDSTAKKLARQFFNDFGRAVDGDQPALAVTVAVAED